MTMISSLWKKLLPLCMVVLFASLGVAGICSAKAVPDMVTIQSVDIGSSKVVLRTDSSQISFDSYKLGAPPRLVVDVMDALPEFNERAFVVDEGYSGVRVGLYADKTRFVFDAADNILPDAQVVQQVNDIVIQWGAAAVASPAEKIAVISSGKPVSVESIDFDAAKGVSVFKVKLSADAKFVPAKVEGDIIRFGVKNAVIPRALRRVVDASVFPSAVLQIIPYSTIIGGERCVMFAANMKGPVEFSVADNGSVLTFRSVDGPFAEAAPPAFGTVNIPVDNSVVDSIAFANNEFADDQVAQVIASLSDSDNQSTDMMDGEVVKVYTGEPVSLVFDDVDIRKVMQLIAEISDQNLILSDNVKGNISLRLHDVPWDQALDLVLEVKELGTINQGNVVRILPQKQIDDMKTARLQAKQKIKTLEETQTQIFEVSYKDVDSIEDVLDDMVSDQGEVSAIDGSKKIMVTDIPSKLIEVAELLKQLDEPVKQVMIEARIVEASNGSDLKLGVNWGVSYDNSFVGGNSTGGSAAGYPTSTNNNAIGLDSASTGLGGDFLLPSVVGTSGIGVAGKLLYDLTTLELKLAALEASDEIKIVSSPKVLALDGEEAEISDGVQIPYKTVSDQGTVTEFQDATLSLKVTPEVNPDGTVILTVEATNSRPGSTYSDGTGIDTKEVKTKLLLKSGETSVIGGVYVESVSDTSEGVPLLKDIPYLGALFRSNINNSSRRELLIFITPRIVSE